MRVKQQITLDVEEELSTLSNGDSTHTYTQR